MDEILSRINEFVWGVPALLGILSIGIYLSVRSGFAQVRLLPKAVKGLADSFRKADSEAGESSFRALCTALAATVGTGNIAGVAGAISLGGPGSIFWMWVCALLGMITKFAEATLSQCYRRKNKKGEWLGGPMYMIELGMGSRWRWLAACYSLLGVVAAFGIGNGTQINAVVDSVSTVFDALGKEASTVTDLLIGAFFSGLAAVSLLGGMKRVGDVASVLVPAASCAYLVLGIGALIVHRTQIPEAFEAIITGAFAPKAFTGGAIGSMFLSIRLGASRGTFTNEAGMGTAAIAHSASSVKHPAAQGYMGIIEVFLDTMVICTLTALVILSSGTPIPYGTDMGAVLTTRAFSCTYGQWISIPMALFLCCFAFATMVGWGFYGLRCAQYLLGEQAWKPFVLLQAAAAIACVLLKTGTVWMLAELVNGCMAIPNLICLWYLSPRFLELLNEDSKKKSALRRFSGR